jgi:hypothetical protein
MAVQVAVVGAVVGAMSKGLGGELALIIPFCGYFLGLIWLSHATTIWVIGKYVELWLAPALQRATTAEVMQWEAFLTRLRAHMPTLCPARRFGDFAGVACFLGTALASLFAYVGWLWADSSNDAAQRPFLNVAGFIVVAVMVWDLIRLWFRRYRVYNRDFLKALLERSQPPQNATSRSWDRVFDWSPAPLTIMASLGLRWFDLFRIVSVAWSLWLAAALMIYEWTRRKRPSG